MWQIERSGILALIIFIAVAHGLLVMGPRFIRANQNYTLVISNFNLNSNKLELMVNVAGEADNGLSALNVTKTVEVRKFMNRMVHFNMPKDLSAGSYKITIDGQRGFSFHKEADLVYLDKSISGLIQIDKPVFNPGDTVKFRVIVLDTELKPPTSVRSVYVTIRDPQKNVIRKWASAKLYAGVFESDLQIAPTPMLGIWNISVQAEGEELVSKIFEVKEYVLSTFDVQVVPTEVPLEEHQALNLTIEANYHFGKPVNGFAKIELYLEDDKLDQKKELVMYGMGRMELRFAGFLEVYDDYREVQVKVSFIEQYTNRTLVKNEKIKVYKYPYRVELVKESPEFRPGHNFTCALKFTHHDGKPAAGIKGNLEINGIDHNPPADTSDSKGLIKLELQPDQNAETIKISFSNDDSGFYFSKSIMKAEFITTAYVKLELNSPFIKLNEMLRFTVTCTEKMSFFVYYIVSKGNIVDAGFMRPNKQTNFQLTLDATEQMVPKAKIIVVTVASDTLVYDKVDINFHRYLNNFDLSIHEHRIRPRKQIELSISGRPGAYVGLAAYDKALLIHSKNHDLLWEDIEQVFDRFYFIDEFEFDKFYELGVFCLTLDGISMANVNSYRSGNQERSTMYNPILRKHFLQSWLWKNVTIGNSGSLKLIEIVPDTTTSWFLTGFSIDPVYGLGIIKKPIQFTTVQSFFIVDNLPYSIKRGEVALLLFTLFNNLGREYIADVTMYNVANQTEFIERPLQDLSFTKSVSVPPNEGVPVSFLVKPRRLGEMVVRVKASIMNGIQSDALAKVIRVIPESILKKKIESQVFRSDTYKNVSYRINLKIEEKVDDGSVKIEFSLNPNLLTTVKQNLDGLLGSRLTGNGEENMVSFASNIVILDYLNAVGSKEQNLINKATNLLRSGYQNQMRYRQTDGSFGVWSSSGGSVFLTAFVAKSMQTASKYITEVDAGMVERAYDWLASKQQSSDRFDEVGSVIHKDMQGGLRNGIALTSYVLVALLENDNAKVKHATVIQKGMNYLSSQFNYISNAYDLSIVTYAMMLNGHSLKDAALKKLIDMSTPINNETERYWNTQNSIEATSYALLSFVKAENYLEGIRIMRWLVNKRYVTGSFPRTQDTFVGLKALTKLAEKISPTRNNYFVYVKYKKSALNFHINSEQINITKNISEDTRVLEINVKGVGFGLLQVVYQYSLDLRNFENRFNLMLEKQNTGSDYELRLRVCASFIPLLSDTHSYMALIEVNFPSGYVVDQNPIIERTTVNPIKNIEIRYGGTSVVLYYYNMGTEKNCFTVTAYRKFKVAMKRPAYVIVYDYYDANLNAIKVYEVDKQTVCEICDPDDCPPECKK